MCLRGWVCLGLMLLLLDFALFVLREVFDIITLDYIGWFMFALVFWWVGLVCYC